MSLRLYLHAYLVFICAFILFYFFNNNTLTIENYAGISHPHGVHGNTSVVAVVLLRHVKKHER